MAAALLKLKFLTDELRSDDDFVDRLSRCYTSSMLIIFAVFLTIDLLVGQTIQCWTPNHFNKEQVKYVNDYCWIAGTYYHPFNRSMAEPRERDAMPRSAYYQWVPLFLLIQSLFFALPYILWRTISGRSGLDVNSVIVTGDMISTCEMEAEQSNDKTKGSNIISIRSKLIERMSIQMDRYLTTFDMPITRITLSWKHFFSRSCFMMCGHRQGNYLFSLYVLIKLLYIVNAVGQLFVLDLFLGSDYHLYGIYVLRAVARGEDWTGSARFPRINMCDFKLRRLGAIHPYTIQCVLPINLFNEKIYLFLWFWLVFIGVITFLSLLIWMIRSLVPIDRTRYIKKHLQLSEKIKITDSDEMKKKYVTFVVKYLRQDGVFILRLLEKSTSVIASMELTAALWTIYDKKTRDSHTNGYKKNPSMRAVKTLPPSEDSKVPEPTARSLDDISRYTVEAEIENKATLLANDNNYPLAKSS